VKRPRLGAAPPPHNAHTGTPIQAEDLGYLCHLNMSGLQRAAREADCTLHVHVRPGSFIGPDTVLATARLHQRPKDIAEIQRNEAPPAPDAETIRNCFVLGAARSYDQDPRFGLIVLGEVALRALSPAVNDPGTAIGVLATLTRLVVEADRAIADREAEAKVAKADKPDADGDGIEFDRVTLPELDIRTLVVDSFAPIARDGAAMLEVGIRLQKMLYTIARNGSAPLSLEARLQARKAMERGLAALSHPDDRRQLEALYEQLFSA
jgi:uncharacterized membrane protein